MADKSKPKKPIYRTDSPYLRPQVGTVDEADAEIITDLPLNVLAPIGEYRAHNLESKGKRRRRRKRDHPESAAACCMTSPTAVNALELPAISFFMLSGFNSVNKHLEKLSRISGQSLELTGLETDVCSSGVSHGAAIFLFEPLDELIYCHLPTLCFTASLVHPDMAPTRLVLLGASAEQKVANALGLSKSSIVALLEPPKDAYPSGVQALLDYVRGHVDAVDAGWLKPAAEARWMGTNVDT